MQLNYFYKNLSLNLPYGNSILATIVLFFSLHGYCFSQSLTTTKINQAKDVYLEENDPVFMAIRTRTIIDLKQHSDPKSANNKLIASKIETMTPEKQDQLQALLIKSITDYTTQIYFDIGTFMLVYTELGNEDPKEIATDNNIRVQYLGGNRYVAEYWEDGLAVNSEAHALVWAHQLATSEYAKKHPNNGVGDVDKVKKTYADVRKSINDGKKPRFNKVMALLYTREKDGAIIFHDPYQSVLDFVER